MSDVAFLELVLRYQDGALGSEDLARLEREMTLHDARRVLFAETLMHAAAAREEFRHQAVRRPEPDRPRYRVLSHAGRPLLASVMLGLGLAIGLAGGRLVWATALPDVSVTSEDVPALADGGFEVAPGALPSGFPDRVGVWGGDASEVVAGGGVQGRHCVRFVRPEPDAGTPHGRAIACDLFQLVDLRSLSGRGGDRGDSVLELSAAFLDDRLENSPPSVTFFCQLYLFRGDPRELHRVWPGTIGDAVATGSAEVTTLGAGGWRRVTARCLVPREVEFAVAHLAARPNLRGPMPAGLFADDVRLVLKSQPALPIKVLDR